MAFLIVHKPNCKEKSFMYTYPMLSEPVYL